MTEYAGLAGLVDDVVEAAIDADMRLRGWIPTGGGYTYVRGEWDTVEVPGPHGGPTGQVQIGAEMPAGTDAVVPIMANPSEEVYGPWRERITSAFEHWVGELPDPAAFGGAIDRVRAGTERLSAGGDAGTGHTSNGGNTSLAATMQTIVSELAPFGGHTIDMFSLNYVNKFQFVCANQCQLAAGVSISLLAEQKIWEEARSAIVTIAEHAKAAFEQSAHGGGGSDVGIKVLGILATAAGMYFSGGVGAVVASQTSSVLGILDGVKSLLPSSETKLPLAGGSPEAVYDNLVEAISKLNDDISTEEGRIQDTMHDVLSAASTHSGEFDLARPTGFFHETDPTQLVSAKNEVALEASTLTWIGLDLMAFVADELTGAATQVSVAGADEMWWRPGAIGLGACGPAYAVADVSEHLVDRLIETGQEMRDAGDRLDIAARAFTQTDAQVHDALAAQTEQLDREEHQRQLAAAPPVPPRGGRVPYI